MKRMLYALLLAALQIAWAIVPASAQETVLMPRWGKETVSVTDEIVFYDYKGTDNIASSTMNNSLATIVFRPASAGQVIQITFEEFDVQSDFGSYMGYVNVYNGEVDPGNTFAYPSTTSEVTANSTLPDGDIIATLDGEYYDQSYLSTATDGSLSVGFIYRYAKSCNGWVARVKAISVEDMEVTGAGADYSRIDAAPSGKTAIGFAGFYVDATGILNPENLTAVSFSIPTNESVFSPSDLKLYAGIGSDFSDVEPIETTLEENGGIYTMRLAQPLKEGRNYFTIAGDINTEAAFGANVQIKIESTSTTSHPDGIDGFATAEPATVTIPYVVLMSAEPASYTIGDNEIVLFDDGGENGKISDKYEGSVTFRPSETGKAIQIDFTNVGLYEAFSGSDSYNDILKVYDGATVDETALNTQVFDNSPVKVRSMAADGSLTVYLKSVTGDYYRGEGFKAVVSQYTPTQMTVTGITTEQVAGKACAGDTDKAVLKINVATENTISLTAESLKFTTEGSSNISHLGQATVYYTGKSDQFSTGTKFGETTATGLDEFSVAGNQKLVEGNNYFWLTYDIDARAQNGETYDAGCLEVTLSGNQQIVENGSPEGALEIENILYSTVGTVEKTVYGSLAFKSTPNERPYYDGYQPEEGDQTTTFVPGTEGMIIELDFSSFDLYYGTNSWTPKAKFEVYSGRDANGELLWSLASADEKSTGPGRILRSRASDGTLTVVFNANTTSSSYTAAGWDAEVREYKSKPMALKSISANQASNEILVKGTKNAEIISINVGTGGNLNPLQLSKFTIDLKGSQNAIDKLHVYSTGSKNEMAATSPLVSFDITNEMTEIEVEFDAPISLLEGDNYYWIAYDIKDDAAAEATLDAAIKSAVIANETIPVATEAGDPEGARVVKNIYMLQNGNNGEIIVGKESLIFYDEGGPDGQTSKNFEGHVTFVPEEAGKAIKLTFTKFGVSSNDTFAVDLGAEVKTTHDYKFDYYTTPDGPIVSTSDDGKITVYFRCPSYSTTSDGWEIEISQYELQPLSITSVDVETVASDNALKGATNLPMLHVSVNVAGDKGDLQFSQFDVSTGGSTDGVISAMSIFSTGTNNAFSVSNRIGGSTGLQQEITTNYAITAPGTYHFWIACDISQSAIPGDMVKATLVSLIANNAEYEPQNEISAQLTVKKGKSGTFSVGKNGNYATIQAAIDDIATGIDGPIVINIATGTYNELVTVPEIAGTSEINTITLQSESGNYADVTISYNYYSEPPYSDDKMAEEYGVFTFSGVDYFTLKNVTVTTTDLTFPSVVHVRNKSRHCTVDHCHVYAERSESATGTDINLIYQYAKNEADCNNDHFAVRNSLIEGGYIGLRIAGTSFVALPKQVGSLVENNTFRNQGSKSLYSPSRDIDFTIRGNVFENTKTQKTDFQAIDIETSEGLIVESNSFYINLPVYATAMNIRKASGTAEKHGRIVNNEIALTSPGASTTTGIKLNSPSSCLDIAYNTVLVTNDAELGGGVALYINDQMTDMTVRNNILQVEDGGVVYRFYKETCIDGIAFSNNVLSTTGTSFAKTSSSTTIDTYEDWVQRSGETNSINRAVTFLSSSILYPADESILSQAMPLDFATTDKEGTPRDPSTPTIGAYEYSEDTETPAYAEGYPAIGGITHVSAEARLMSTTNAVVHLLVRPTSEPAPTADEIDASSLKIELRKGKEAAIKLEGLARQTEYKLYSILSNLTGSSVSEILESEPFTTSYTPTAVSTFEDVTTTEDGFDDGTASFTGFSIESTTDAVVEGDKVAKIGENAVVTLTNTDKGLPLTGFFLKSDGNVTITIYDGNGEIHPYTAESTYDTWIFYNLKDKGTITALEMATNGNAYIDNFSGEPLPIEIATAETEIAATEGSRATLSATVSGGVAPYSFSWKDAMRNEIATTASCQTPELSHSGAYTVEATDAWGNSANARVLVYVEGSSHVATFDDNYLDDESYYNGLGEDDSDWTSPGTDSKFFSGSYSFDTNRHSDSWWGGFGISNQTSTDFASLSDQFKSAAGGGHESVNYAVVYSYDGAFYYINPTHAGAEGSSVEGFYVTNAAYAADAIVNGDGMTAGSFAKGDWFKLIVKGEKPDGSVSTVEYYLADYRSENEPDHYYLDTWQWVDLRPLGTVTKISFAFDGSRKNSYGLTTPTYFCMDDFGGTREIFDAPTQLAGTSKPAFVNLREIFDLDDDASSVAFKLEDAYDTDKASLTIDGENLCIEGLQDQTALGTVVSAMQRGKLQFARIPIEIDEAKAGVALLPEEPQVRIFPIPATNVLNIRTAMTGYTVTVYTAEGVQAMAETNCNGNITLPVSQLAKGVYVLVLHNEARTVVERFIVK